MKKIALTFVTLLVMLVLVSPAVCGFLAGQKEEELWRYFAKRAHSELVVHKSYGWLSSNRDYTIQLAASQLKALAAKMPDQTKAPSPTLKIHSHFYHGPWPFQFPGGAHRPALGKTNSEISFSLTGDSSTKLPGVLSTTVKLNRSLQQDYRVAAGEHATPMGTMNWSDITAQMMFNSALSKIKANGSMDKFVVASMGKEVGVSGVTFRNAAEKSTARLWDGEGALGIDRLYAKNEIDADELFELLGLAVNAEVAVNTDLVDYNVVLKGKELNFPQAKKLALDFNLRLSRLDASALDQLLAVIEAMQSGEQQPLNAFGDMMSAASDLISRGPTLDQNLVISTPAGEISAKISLQFPENAGGLTLANLQQNLRGNAEIHLPKVLLHRIAARRYQEAQLQDLLLHGVLSPQGNDYVIKAVYETGRLVVNGREMPLPLGPNAPMTMNMAPPASS